MAVVEQWLESKLGPVVDGEAREDGEGSRSGRSAADGGGGAGKLGRGAGGAGGRKLAGQKRQLPSDDRDASRDDDDEDDEDRTKRAKTDLAEGCRKFACPYYKHDPATFANCRSCVGPGYPSIHRLK